MAKNRKQGDAEMAGLSVIVTSGGRILAWETGLDHIFLYDSFFVKFLWRIPYDKNDCLNSAERKIL